MYTIQKNKRIWALIRLWFPYFKTTLSTDHDMYKAKTSHGDWNVSDVFINKDNIHVNQNISPHFGGEVSIWCDRHGLG